MRGFILPLLDRGRCPANDLVLYRAIYAQEWYIPPDPLRARRAYFRANPPGFPAGRWNDAGYDALYTSHDPRTAWREKMENLPTLVTSDLASTASTILLALIQLPAIPVSAYRTYEGHCRRILLRPDLRQLLQKKQYEFAQAFSRELTDPGPLARLIVPSAPVFNRRAWVRSIRWNSVYFVGELGQLAETNLPSKGDMRLVHAGPPRDTPRSAYPVVLT
jgi:RES domain-containing protein